MTVIGLEYFTTNEYSFYDSAFFYSNDSHNNLAQSGSIEPDRCQGQYDNSVYDMAGRISKVTGGVGAATSLGYDKDGTIWLL